MSSVQFPFLSNIPYQCNSAVICSPTLNSIGKAPLLVFVKPHTSTTTETRHMSPVNVGQPSHPPLEVAPTAAIEPIQYQKVPDRHSSPKFKSAYKLPESFKSYTPSSRKIIDEEIPTYHSPEVEKKVVSSHRKQHSYHPQQNLPEHSVDPVKIVQKSLPSAKVEIYEPEIKQTEQPPFARSKSQVEDIKVDLIIQKVNTPEMQASPIQEENLHNLNLLYNDFKRKAYENLVEASILKEHIENAQEGENSNELRNEYSQLVQDAMHYVEQADLYRRKIEALLGSSVTSKASATKIDEPQTEDIIKSEITGQGVDTTEMLESALREETVCDLNLFYNKAHRSFEGAKKLLEQSGEITPEVTEQYIQRMKNVNHYVEQANLCRKQMEKRVCDLEGMYNTYKSKAYIKFLEADALKEHIENKQQEESCVQLKEQYDQVIRDAMYCVEQADFCKKELEKILETSVTSKSPKTKVNEAHDQSVNDADYIKFDVNIPEEDISRMHASAGGINFDAMNEKQKKLYVLEELYQQHKRDAYRSLLAADELKGLAAKGTTSTSLQKQYDEHIRNGLQHVEQANHRKQQIEDMIGIKFTYTSHPSEDIGWSRSQNEEDTADKIFGKPPSFVSDSAFL